MKLNKLSRFQKLVLVIALALSTILPSVACQAGDGMDLTCAANPHDNNCDAW